jgi:Glycosyl transferase family 2
MPVFNGDKYLNEAIESILMQSFRDFEFIIVNDGSTDRTRDIIEAFSEADSRIAQIHQQNTGIVGALNAGLALARGRYLARMDADDIALPHRFAFQAAYLDQHPECVLVGGYAETFNDEGRDVGISTGGWRPRTDLASFPPKIAVAIHPLIVMRTQTLCQMGGYRGGYPHAEDYDLFIRASQYGEIHNPPEVVLRYRTQPQSVSARYTEAQEWAALAAEFAAMDMTLPAVPGNVALAAPVSVNPDAGKSMPSATVYTYFWFRVWRRRRGSRAAFPALREMIPFLVGLKPGAWDRRYGLPLRARILGSMIFHSAAANAFRLWLRRRRAGKMTGTAARA